MVFKVLKSKIHSSFDLRSGFHQVPMTERAMPLTAFSSHKGYFMYLRMPFGLVNAPFTMNSLMHKVFDHCSEFVSFFFDDIFCHSDSVDEHIHHVDQTLEALINANLQVSPEKTTMFSKEVSVLGH